MGYTLRGAGWEDQAQTLGSSSRPAPGRGWGAVLTIYVEDWGFL